MAGEAGARGLVDFGSTLGEQPPQRVTSQQFELESADCGGFVADLEDFRGVLEGLTDGVEVGRGGRPELALLGVEYFAENGRGHQQGGD